jgi:hypothetical protein
LQCSDPFARGGDRHRFWWADASYLRPGLFYRRRRILPLPAVPRFSVAFWRVEIWSSAHWDFRWRRLNAYGPPPRAVRAGLGPLRIVFWYRDREARRA